MNILFRIYRVCVQTLCVPIFLSDFFDNATGREYGIRFTQKVKLVYQMIRNNIKIISGSTFLEHVQMATSLMKLPKSKEGVVVECGTYKGVSAANISLVCALTGRKLEIFDSFEGLPAPDQKDQAHVLLGSEEIHTYEKGAWCGRLDEVKDNIRRYGCLEVCGFHQGFFEQTLPHFKGKCVQIFVDVDYRLSLETCVKYLWPLLQNEGFFYTHEAQHMEIASLFFSESWWKENGNSEPPGLVGAGSGIGIKILKGSAFTSSLGFTIKNPKRENFQTVPQEGGMKLGIQSLNELTDNADSSKGRLVKNTPEMEPHS